MKTKYLFLLEFVNREHFLHCGLLFTVAELASLGIGLIGQLIVETEEKALTKSRHQAHDSEMFRLAKKRVASFCSLIKCHLLVYNIFINY